MSPETTYRLRRATPADADLITYHRRAMFEAMGYTDAASSAAMGANFVGWVRERLERDVYRGWLAIDPAITEREVVIAGAGLWIIDWPPHILDPRTGRAYILNIYTDPAHRRRGLARWLTQTIIDQYIEGRAGLLIGRGQDKYGWRVFTFPHRTFQEYLAGCHLASDRLDQNIVDYARRGAAWWEALMLATGHLVFNDKRLSDPLYAVQALMGETETPHTDADWRMVWLAGDMLKLIELPSVEGHKIGQRVLPLVRQRLAALVGGGHLPVTERASAGRILSVLGDPRPGVGCNPTTKLPDIAWCEVPAGEFIYQDGEKRTLERFFIAKYPITYMQFQAFLDADDGYRNPEWWKDLHEEGQAQQREGADDQWYKYWNHPRENISWYDSMAFCKWLNHQVREGRLTLPDYIPAGFEIRLPTEAEWEKAARGTDGRKYPYEGPFDANKGNTDETGLNMTSAVGMFPAGASPYGALDMSGNVWEWTRTEHDAEINNDISNNKPRVLRGGSWNDTDGFARAVYRDRNHTGDRSNGTGCRVVSSAPIK
jgi:formylglycine-generating enzyme required for sulfatase activity/ribosomal protein S18 acetylase RimI-like enzyme